MKAPLKQGDVMKVGWIGLGQIGTQMVKRLCAAHFDVTVHPRGQGRAEAAAAGAMIAPDYATLAVDSDALFLCVYDEAQGEAVLFDEGTLAALRPGSLLVIHTTASPQALRRIGEHADLAGIA